MSERSPIELVANIVERYRISSLQPLIESCRAFEQDTKLNVAVLGRFKAGKSSFLNNLLGLELLPVGVVPVTAVICEIAYGSSQRARIRYLDGSVREAALEEIRELVDERRNPDNTKKVRTVLVELPSLARFSGIRFVDTPGLESLLTHNTEVSRNWLPNVGLALVAVAVDPPLSEPDVELIRELHRYTPNVSVLLTKVDLLDERSRTEVLHYVQAQLNRNVSSPVPVLPYSIRSGYEYLREDLERGLLAQAIARTSDHRKSVLARKTETLLRECMDYLTVAMKAAEAAESERELLKKRILGEKESLDESKLALRLIVRHATANTRTLNEKILKKHETPLNDLLVREFNRRFPEWTTSLKNAAARFEDWLSSGITAEMVRLSDEHQADFSEPLHRVGRQLSQSLQDFRNRISERTIEALGIPLRTTEIEIQVESPHAPDIRIGKIFDRNWELISFLLPMTLVKGMLKKHFERKVADVVFKNLSRLAFQWEQIVNIDLGEMEKQAIHRMDDLVTTLDNLLTTTGSEAAGIGKDLAEVEQALKS